MVIEQDLEDKKIMDTSDDDDDEDDEDDGAIRHRASTIVKVMRLEKSVNSINSKLEDLDPNVMEANRVKLVDDIKKLSDEINSIKEKLDNAPNQDNSEANAQIIARLEALEEAPKPIDDNHEENSTKAVDFEALSMRVEKLETAIKLMDSKKHPSGGASVASFASKMSFVAFLLAIAGFAIKAYTYIMSNNTSNSTAYDAAKKMSEACNDVMMYVAGIGAFTGVLSLIGLFVGKGKRGAAFIGVILSVIAIFAFVAFKYMGILEIE
ncbi:MAG: hypothetical protein K6G48_05935 [Acholeplasmatales bacterium]|nr:hypothetical protein [Acholeplasmatales bacterium]